MSLQRFRGADRLKTRRDFRRVQSQGRKVHTQSFLVLLHPSLDGETSPKIGFTVTRKVGHAPSRNRFRRVLREVFRRNRGIFPDGCDTVIIVKRGAEIPSYQSALKELEGARGRIRKIGRELRGLHSVQ